MFQTLNRCYRLLVAMKMESEKVSSVANDEKAKTMAILKINLMGYVMEIWPNRQAFDDDIAILNKLMPPDMEKSDLIEADFSGIEKLFDDTADH